MLEMASGDHWVGDRSEGVSFWSEENLLVNEKPASGDFAVQFDAETGAVAMSGPKKNLHVTAAVWNNNVILGGMSLGTAENTRTHVVDGYAFCFSKGNLETLWPVMCRAADDDPYDAAVEIADLKQFVPHLYFLGQFQIENHPPAYVRDHFRIEWGPVNYTSANRRHDITVSDTVPLMAGGLPFIKGAEYAEQSECRIVLYPHQPITDPSLRIGVPNIENLISCRRRQQGAVEHSRDYANDELRAARQTLIELSAEGLGDRIAASQECREEVFRKVAKVYLTAYRSGFNNFYFDFMMNSMVNSQGPVVLPAPVASAVVRTCIAFLEGRRDVPSGASSSGGTAKPETPTLQLGPHSKTTVGTPCNGM
jgi:hypothetical protein